MTIRKLCTFCILGLYAYSQAQEKQIKSQYPTMKMSGFMQGLLYLEKDTEKHFNIKKIEPYVRRMRFIIKGTIMEGMTYKAQFNFFKTTRLFDAYVKYEKNKNWSVYFGQMNIPFNLISLTSSAKLHLIDFGFVSREFGVERGFGLRMDFKNYWNSSKIYHKWHIAVSAGEYINNKNEDEGFLYMIRQVLYPLGAFSKGNDIYVQGDLAKEQNLKLALGLGYLYADKVKTSSQIIYQKLSKQVSYHGFTADFITKYKGFSLTYEGIWRHPTDAHFISKNDFIFAGNGQDISLGYMLNKHYEVAYRYAHRQMIDKAHKFVPNEKRNTLAISRFLKGHNAKLQTDFTFKQQTFYNGQKVLLYFWRFQLHISF